MTSKYKGYGQGYTTFSYHVSNDHEAEALKAERAQKPNRFGMWMLRLLGFKGTPPGSAPGEQHAPDPDE